MQFITETFLYFIYNIIIFMTSPRAIDFKGEQSKYNVQILK